jgi:predicted site-specific integrase-resolvase
MSQETFIPTKEACKILGVTPTTLRSWDKNGQIRTIRTPTNMRRYSKQDVLRIADGGRSSTAKKRILYCRVSSKKQVDDLARQKELLESKYPDYSMVTDVGSGINWKRKGLREVLESAMSGDLEEVVVAHRDRLCRFAFELIELIIVSNGGKLTVLDHDDSEAKERELAEDILSIVHVYSCRQMGRRRYKSKKDKDLSHKISD